MRTLRPGRLTSNMQHDISNNGLGSGMRGPVVHNNNIDGENMEFIGVAIVWQGELPPSTQHQRQSSAKPIGPSRAQCGARARVAVKANSLARQYESRIYSGPFKNKAYLKVNDNHTPSKRYAYSQSLKVWVAWSMRSSYHHFKFIFYTEKLI